MDGSPRPSAPPPRAAETPANAAVAAPVAIDTANLFAGRDEIRLLHRGQEYRLRVTRQGKLILTK